MGKTSRTAELIEEGMDLSPRKPDPWETYPDRHRNAIVAFWVSCKKERGVEPHYVMPVRSCVVPSKVDGYFWLQQEFNARVSREDAEGAMMRDTLSALCDELVYALMHTWGVPMLHSRAARFELTRNFIESHKRGMLKTAIMRASRVCGIWYMSFAMTIKETEEHSLDQADRLFPVFRRKWFNNYCKAVEILTGLNLDKAALAVQTTSSQLDHGQKWFPSLPNTTQFSRWLSGHEKASTIHALNDAEQRRVIAAIAAQYK